MVSHLESLEALIDINRRIRIVERIILELSKEQEASRKDEISARIAKSIDELLTIIDDVEVRANELDVQLSAIERLSDV